MTEQPTVIEAATLLGVTPSQIGLAWLLRHDPNILLIPGTADIAHLQANIAASAIELDHPAMTAVDAVPSG